MICGNGPCGRSAAFAWRQSRPCSLGPLFTKRWPSRLALRASQAGFLKRPGNGHALPAVRPCASGCAVSTAGSAPHRRGLRPRRPAAAAARFVGPHGRALQRRSQLVVSSMFSTLSPSCRVTRQGRLRLMRAPTCRFPYRQAAIRRGIRLRRTGQHGRQPRAQLPTRRPAWPRPARAMVCRPRGAADQQGGVPSPAA